MKRYYLAYGSNLNVRQMAWRCPTAKAVGIAVSKLMLKQDGRVVYNYDRGEDVELQTPEAEKALAILLHEYN